MPKVEVNQEEDCFGYDYLETDKECKRCGKSVECKRLTEQRAAKEAAAKVEPKKEEPKIEPKVVLVPEQQEEPKPKETVSIKKVEPKVEPKKAVSKPKLKVETGNPYRKKSGAFYTFQIMLEGGTMDEMTKRLGVLFKKHSIKAAPRGRLVWLFGLVDKPNPLADYRLEQMADGGKKIVIKEEG